MRFPGVPLRACRLAAVALLFLAPSVHSMTFAPKSARSAAEAKVESNLLHGVRARQAQRASPAVALPANVAGFVSANVTSDDYTTVVVRTADAGATARWLREAGARSVAEFPAYDTVTAEAPVDGVLELAARAEVRQVGPRERWITHALKGGASLQRKVGSLTSAAVAAHDVLKSHDTGMRGAGVKVCVISDGIDTSASRIATGDLPASLTALTGQRGAGDEGTAMLEIVYDLAPAATLAFATAIPSAAQFATNITSLQSVLGCQVIVDDVAYLNEPAFQDGPIARAVNTVTAAGALYFSAAGNSGNLTHNTSGTWEGDFQPTGTAIPAAIVTAEGPGQLTLHSFGIFPYATITGTQIVSLHWSDPYGASGNDYDLFVMDPTGTTILASSLANQTGQQDPYEQAECNGCTFPDGSRVYIVRFSGAARALRIDAHGGRISGGTSGSTFGHNAAASAITVGAVDVRSAAGGVFVGGASNPVTLYSSDGPRRIFYNASGVALTGTPLFSSGGQVINKVDLAAADCGNTTTPSFVPFCGTSAAAPTAAAIAALVKSAKPSATAAQVKAALVASALNIEAAGVDRDSGAGIVMAPAAVRGVLSPPTVAKSFTPATVAPGAASTLRISITNPNEAALSGLAFTDTYVAPMVNASSPAFAVGGPGCAATATALANAGSFGITAATIPAGVTCTYSVAVTSPATGTFVDAGGAVTTPIALNAAAASATLQVGTAPGAPTLVSAVAGTGLVTVSFLAPGATGGFPITQYAATCTSVATPSAGVPASPVTVTGAASPLAVAGLTNGFAYTCTVKATNAIGTGAPSGASPQVVPNLPPVTVAVSKAGTGTGTIASSVGGLDCGATCSASIVPGTPVTLTATASPGSVFTGWSGGPCSGASTCTFVPTANTGTTAFFTVLAGPATLGIVATGSLDFGGQSLKTPAPAVGVDVINVGGAPLALTGFTVSGAHAADFPLASACGASLAPAATCRLTVGFTPQASGARAATLSIATSAASVSYPLAGTGELSLVTHYYRAILRRAPDAPGKAFWQGEALRMQSGGANLNETWYAMAQAFYGSPEYAAFNRDTNGFVTDLYTTFFNRAPDGPGLAFWAGQVAQGMPREVVLAAFMFSTEFTTFTQSIFGNTQVRREIDMVTDFYRGLLARLPDDGGLAFWVSVFRSAQCQGAPFVTTQADNISGQFAQSAEYAGRGRTNAQFVGDVYNAFLRRGGDLAGVQFWVDALGAATLTREQVRQQFVASPEFQARVQLVIAQGCLP